MTKKAQYILTFFFVLVSISLQAQELCMKQFTTKDGLPSMTVYDIYQSSDGYLWFGTKKSICRFDGKEFKSFNSPLQNSLDATIIREDPWGRIWFQNFRQQLFYIQNDSITLFSVRDSLKKAQQQLIVTPLRPSNETFLKYEMGLDGLLWIATNNGIYSYNLNNNQWGQVDIKSFYQKHSPITTEINNLIDNFGYLAKQNQLFFTLLPLGNMKYDIKTQKLEISSCNHCQNYPRFDFKHLRRLDENPSDPAFFVELVQPFRLLKYEHGQYSYNFQIDTFLLEKRTNPIGVYIDLAQNQWVYSYNGILKLAPSGKKTHLFPMKAVSEVFQDHEQNYWFSTLKDGLFMAAPQDFINFSLLQENGQDYKVDRIELTNKKELILGSSSSQFHKVVQVKEHKLSTSYHYHSPDFHELELLYYDSIYSKLYLEQNHFYSFEDSLAESSKFKTVTGKNLKTNKSVAWPILGEVRSVKSIDKDYLLVGLSSGVTILRQDKTPLTEAEKEKFGIQSYSIGLNDKSEEYIYMSLARPVNCNEVYVISPQKFLLAYTDSLFLYTLDKGGQSILDLNNQSISNVNTIRKTSDGSIWIATVNQGILKYQAGKIVDQISEKEGLLDKNIEVLRADGMSLWAVSNNHVQHINLLNNEISTYNQKDGLIDVSINDLIIRDEKVWLGYESGLISFNKNTPAKNTTAPPILLEEVQIIGHDSSSALSYQLNYKQNDINVHFKGICFRCLGEQDYVYQMQGLSDEWKVLPTNQELISFYSLPPNKYQLTIYAVNEDGVQSKEPIVIHFEISSPYWQTWWFRGLITLIILGFLSWQLWLMRRRQQMHLRMNQLRSQALQSQMNPHFIFNALNAIQRLMIHSSTEHAMGYLTKFARLIRQIFEISSLKALPLEKEEEFLRLYLDLEKLRFKEKVDIQFEIDPALEEDFYEVPPLLVQPVIENSFKHGLLHKEAKGHLLVKFEKKGDFIHILVEDDGIGRQAAAKYAQSKKNDRKSGLSLTQNRLEMLPKHPKLAENYRVTDLQDDNGKACGTRTELWIKLDFNQ